MWSLREIGSARIDEIRRRKFTLFRNLRSQPALATIVCVLILIAVAACWLGIDSSIRQALNPHIEGVAPAAARGNLTMAEMVALKLIEGVGSRDRPKPSSMLPSSTGGAGAPTHEQALLALLETGSGDEALEAIHGWAALGGAANRQRFRAIMNDDGWSVDLRTEAALALLRTGAEANDAVASVRALAMIGGDTNADTLNAMLKDASLPQSLRLEAALGLGGIATPRAGEALIGAFGMFSDPEIHEQLIGAMGHLPFPQIQSTWKQLLDGPDTPDDLRVAAADALSNSSSESLPFLKTLAQSDRDPNVREMAAWAISAHGDNGSLGKDLALMAAAEPEADVRRRLYEALLAQAENPAANLLPEIRRETDVAARVAGFNALGDAVKRGVSRGLMDEFDAQIVPELTKIAASPETLNIRMRAVFALRRADTSAARQALQVISQTQTPQIASAARHGLEAAK